MAFTKHSVSTEFIVDVKGAGNYSVRLGNDKSKFLDRIDRVTNDLDDRLKDLINTKEKLEKDKIFLEKNIDNKFDKYDEIENIKNEIRAIDKKLNNIN